MAYGDYSPWVLKIMKQDGSIIDLADIFNTLRRSLVVMSDSEQKLLEGAAFHAFFETVVSAGDNAYFSFTTGPKPIIANIQTFTVNEGVVTIEMFEDADATGGSNVTIFNMDRTNTTPCSVTISNAPTVNAEGIRIDKTSVGSTAIANNVITSIINGYLPWRLKPNTTYLVKFSNADTSDINVITRILMLED